MTGRGIQNRTRITVKDSVTSYYTKIKNGELSIAGYVHKAGDNFEGLDTNRFTSYVFAETGFKPTTIERVFRDLRRADRTTRRTRATRR